MSSSSTLRHHALALGGAAFATFTGIATAQVPLAEPANSALTADAANDFFQRGKNLHDAAATTADPGQQIELYQRAAQLFSEYLASFPNHPNAEMAWWYLGISEFKSGNTQDAKRCFSTLINRWGEGRWAAAAAYTLAADHYNQGEYALAAPLFERYAKNAAKAEERPRGRYFAGNCYRLLKRDREAITAFNAVLADPNGAAYHADTKLALGFLLLNIGKLRDAVSRFEEAFGESSQPKTKGEAALQIALASIKLGNTTTADRYLRLILDTATMADYHEDARSALMGNLYAAKEFKEIVRIHQSGSTTNFSAADAPRLMTVARAYMRLKQPANALGLFREIEKLVAPDHDLAFQASYYRLLCFYEIEGKHVPDQVDAFLELYRRGRPNDSRIHTALLMKAESLLAENKFNEAAKTYAEINSSAISKSNLAGLLYQRGWCLAEAGDPKGAIRSLSEFIAQYPKDERVLHAYAKRATCYVQISESAKAIADFDQLTKPSVPTDLQSFAWLESARMRRHEANIPDMIARYRGLLDNIDSLSVLLQSESNYWIGWGMVKTNDAAKAASYLEKARALRPTAYNKHAGILLALGYYAAQDAGKLAGEIKLAIERKYDADIPDQAIQWCGIQSYNSGDFEMASTCLALVSSPDDPRATPKEVWRYLGKARIETGNYEAALRAIHHALEIEEDLSWKADGLLDRATALFALKKVGEARKSADEALALRPQGRTSGKLRILLGDIDGQSGDHQQAAAQYLVVVQFMEDRELKPVALHKLAESLEQQGNATEAQTYRKQLQQEFPDWKPE